MNKKIEIIIFLVVIVLMLGLKILGGNFVIVQAMGDDNENIDNTYGIIDGHLSKEHENVNFCGTISIDEKNISHGDLILEFITKYNKQICPYYYDAENNNGKIDSESIIEGLEWMLDNRVEYVSISLSSNYYSKKLDTWITKHSDDITIYASYNNIISSIDYPAQYDGVIGIGSDKRISYKENDVQFDSNCVLLISDRLYLYSGNSYLAPLYMLQVTSNKNK